MVWSWPVTSGRRRVWGSCPTLRVMAWPRSSGGPRCRVLGEHLAHLCRVVDVLLAGHRGEPGGLRDAGRGHRGLSDELGHRDPVGTTADLQRDDARGLHLGPARGGSVPMTRSTCSADDTTGTTSGRSPRPVRVRSATSRGWPPTSGIATEVDDGEKRKKIPATRASAASTPPATASRLFRTRRASFCSACQAANSPASVGGPVVTSPPYRSTRWPPVKRSVRSSAVITIGASTRARRRAPARGPRASPRRTGSGSPGSWRAP